MSKDQHHRYPVPAEIAPLVEAIRVCMNPAAVWLFGSRARGDARSDSDWDLLIGLPDGASDSLLDPLAGWNLQRDLAISATIVTAKLQDLEDSWGVPNTLGYEIARDGKRLDV